MLKTQSMNLDYVRTFVVVGQSKDYRDAANKLNIDHTNVSRHIKALEEIMETKLVSRSSKKIIELTKEGKKLFDGYEKAYNILMFTEKSLRQNRSLDSGKISIGVSSDIDVDLLNNNVKRFKELYPSIVLKIVTFDTKELFEKLEKYYIDFVIDETYSTTKKDNDIKSKIISNEKYCIAYNNDKKISKIKDLNELPLIVPISSKQDRVRLEAYLQKNKIKKNISLEVDNYDSARDYAIAGLGYALLPKRIVEKTKLNSFDIDLNKEISIFYVNGNLSPSSKEFLKLF